MMLGAPSSKRALLFPLLVYMVLALGWLVVLPPWQGPDEPGHYEYARLLARLRRPPHLRDADPLLQARIIQDLDRSDFWRLTRQSQPEPLPLRFAEIPFFQRSGTQLGNESPWYYLVPALIIPLLPEDLTLHLYVGRIYSVLLGAGIVLVGGWATRYRFPAAPHLAAITRWGLALLPMPLFVHATFTPNVLADLVGAGFFALGWMIVRARGKVSTRHWLLFGLTVLFAQTTKRTTLVVLPLAAWLLLVPEHAPLRRWRRPLILLAGGVALALLLFPSIPHEAAEWERDRERSPAWRVAGQGIDGSAAFFILDRSRERRLYIAQNLLADDVPRVWDQAVVATAQVRGGRSAAWVCLSVIDRVAQSATCTRAGQEWHTLRVQHRVNAGTPFVRVVVGIGAPRNWRATGEAFVDDVTLSLQGRAGNLLRNGNAEIPRSRPVTLARRVLRVFHLGPSTVYTPRRWEYPLVYRIGLAAAVLFASFWGNFGWLQYPLPLGLYVGLALISLLAAAGVLRAFQRAGPDDRRLLVFDATSLLLAVTGSMIPVLGADWLPQGRYLFPTLLPILALIAQGLDAWRPRAWSPTRWTWICTGMTALFSLFALVWVFLTMRGILL